jgi:hypothetical protein
VTGDLQVNVTDNDGAPLPGATVVIESPVLIGQRSMLSDKNGIARFNALPPGVYSVKASMPGFTSVVTENVPIKLDSLTKTDVGLPEQLTETVTVVAEAPLVDVTSTTTGQDLDIEFVDTLPTNRSYQTNLALIPGVGPGANPAVHGSTNRDNLYLIDGVNTTDPVTGTFGANINFEIIQEQQISTAGLPAEYGAVTGLVSNLVTKSGGNLWSGTINYFRTDRDWADSVKAEAIGANETTNWDYAYTLGGPIIKDRLWHFTSWQVVGSETTTDFEDTSVSRPDREFDGDYYFAKLSLQATPNHRLTAHVTGDPAEIRNQNFNDPDITEDQFYGQDQGGDQISLRYTGVLGPNMVLEGQINRFRSDLDAFPMRPELEPNHTALLGGTSEFGRYVNEQYSDRDRDEIKLDLSYFKSTRWGEHNFKFGAQYIETDFASLNINSGGESFFDLSFPSFTLSMANFNPYFTFPNWWSGLGQQQGWGCTIAGVPCDQFHGDPGAVSPADWQMDIGGTIYTPFDFTFGEPALSPVPAGEGWTRFERYTDSDFDLAGVVGQDVLAFYVQDDWRVGKWNFRLGVRVEEQELRNSDDRAYFEWDTTVAPRVGITYDLKGNGRQKIYTHYGRLYDPLRDNTASFSGNLSDPLLSSMVWAAPLNQYLTYQVAGGPGIPGAQIAPVVDTPYTDEYLLGWAMDIGENMAIEVTGFHRETKDITEDFDPIAGFGDPALYPTLQDDDFLASQGIEDTNGDGVINANDMESRFLIYNPPGAEREYDGAEVTFRKRMSARWAGIVSYTYSDATGNVTNDGLFGIVGDDPYLDPRLWYNEGKLAFDRDHTVKIDGSYRFPFGLTLGTSMRWLSGLHYSMTNIPTPDANQWLWDGDPSKIVAAIGADRDAFATQFGIPVNDPTLDRRITELMPFDLKPGRGAYENPDWYEIDIRVKYDFKAWKDVKGEVFLDIDNVLNDQRTLTRDSDMATFEAVTPSNIGDRSVYTFQRKIVSQAPREYMAGLRFAF